MSSRAKRGDLVFQPRPESEIASSRSLLAMTIKFRCRQFRKSRAQSHCAEWWDNLSNIRRKALTLFRPTGLKYNIHKLGRGGQMKYFWSFLIIFILCGCASSGPQSIGRDSYMQSVRVSFSGATGAKSDALKAANLHCANQGKQMLLTEINSGECAWHGGCGEAQITYMCLTKDDPRYETPQLRKETN